jgi:hypothetical protein
LVLRPGNEIQELAMPPVVLVGPGSGNESLLHTVEHGFGFRRQQGANLLERGIEGIVNRCPLERPCERPGEVESHDLAQSERGRELTGEAVDELPALLPAVALVVDGKPRVFESLEVAHHRAAAAAESLLELTESPTLGGFEQTDELPRAADDDSARHDSLKPGCSSRVRDELPGSKSTPGGGERPEFDVVTGWGWYLARTLAKADPGHRSYRVMVRRPSRPLVTQSAQRQRLMRRRAIRKRWQTRQRWR